VATRFLARWSYRISFMNRHRPDRSTAAGGLRLFVAVPLPPEVLTRAGALLARLAASGTRQVRWADPRRLHLTLAFLGAAVTEDRVPAIATALDRACPGFAPFLVACGGLGRFPAAGRPRVIWLGLRHGESALVHLQAAVADAIEPLGFPRESRPWQPHVTLGRLPDHGRAAPLLMAALADEADCDGGSGIVDEVVLYASERTPAGSAYRVVHATPLGSR
jgi:2'-5' RNA ligase